MIPPGAITRERSQQELILKMIEGQILHYLLGPRPKTSDPQNDHTMWQRKDSSQYWKQAVSSGSQWRPRLRSDEEISSVAGDTSDTSAAAYRLKSICENEGEAVKGSRGTARLLVVTPIAPYCMISNDTPRQRLAVMCQIDTPGATVPMR